MDFTDTPEEAAYRAKVTAWLSDNAERRQAGRSYKARYGDDSLLPLAQEWQTKKHAAGFAGMIRFTCLLGGARCAAPDR